MRNECNIIRDILPLYTEKMVSADTASFVEAHMESCEKCREILNGMKNPDTIDKIYDDISSGSKEDDAKQLKAFKRKWNRKKIVIAITSSISTAALFFAIFMPDITINGTDYSMVFLGLVGAAISFALQLLFCYKAKKISVKLIPVYISLLGLLFCILMFFGVFGTISGGFIGNIHTILAFLLGVIVCIACLGEIIAWIVYGIHQSVRKKSWNR